MSEIRTGLTANPTDRGSVLPLLLGAVGLLLILTMTLLGACQFLQQQRLLNSKTDAIALDLTQTKVSSGETLAALEELAARDVVELYGDPQPLRLSVTQPLPGSVQVGYCERSRVTIGAVIWGGRALVCAQSRAETR